MHSHLVYTGPTYGMDINLERKRVWCLEGLKCGLLELLATVDQDSRRCGRFLEYFESVCD